MKKVALFIILTFLFQVVFAQKEEWTKHFEKSKEATALDDDFFKTPEASKIPPIISKYEEAIDLINQTVAKSADYTAAANYKRAWIYKQIAYMYNTIDDDTNEETYADKAFDIWPTFGSLSQSEIKKHLTFNNSDPIDKTYTELIYLGVNAAFSLYD